MSDTELHSNNEEEFDPNDVLSSSSSETDERAPSTPKRVFRRKSKKKTHGSATLKESSPNGKERRNRTVVDDGLDEVYETRIAQWKAAQKRRKSIVDSAVAQEQLLDDDTDGEAADLELDFYQQYESAPDFITEETLRIPAYIYHNLYSYQVKGVEWLWDIHQQNAGGIMGDEMGLGKTVQLIAYLASLKHTEGLHCVLLACPASVLYHWVREFHKWYPAFRVVVLHASGSAVSNNVPPKDIISSIEHHGGILITTYATMRQNQERILPVEWDYVVLDEGHCIRNPDAEITLVCKQLQTVHRILLTGTPIQNSLRELWSLFDFVFPGRLGTLPTFEDEFVLPIKQGGYSKASRMHILMAYKCAVMLRELINPYLLRRMKKEVEHIIKLPDKTEQIIFCNLTETQIVKYKAFLDSDEVKKVLSRDIKSFRAINILRKICNHSDILDVCLDGGKRGYYTPNEHPWSTGCEVQGSGKMIVLDKVLNIWHKQCNRVLLFSQTRLMLDGIEQYVQSKGWKYCRLDGGTAIKSRQTMIDRFNSDNSVFIFLLTTRAGGVGVNLMGANRVLIYDPDWNPSTDMQARERSWRLGQTKAVTIYRLITCGGIEEKIYQRQLFKQYLTNKVLKDPKQRSLFNRNRLRDLFTLAVDDDSAKADCGGSTGTETGDLFYAGHVSRPYTTDCSSSKQGSTTNKRRSAVSNTSFGGNSKKIEPEKAKSAELVAEYENIDDNEVDQELEKELKDVGGRIEAHKRLKLVSKGASNDSGDETMGDDDVDVDDDDEDDDDDLSGAKQESDGSDKQENRLMIDKLFDGVNVKSIFSHDALEEDNLHTKERELVEMEARKVANDAVRVLKMSRDRIRSERRGVFEPTWTGKSGLAGNPSKPRFGSKVSRNFTAVRSDSQRKRGSPPSRSPSPNAQFGSSSVAGFGRKEGMASSSQLLKKFKRSGEAQLGIGGDESGTSKRASTAVDRRERLAAKKGCMTLKEISEELFGFLSETKVSGRSTEDILHTFGAVVKPEDKVSFRKVLREIATCKGTMWRLKKEFLA